jgi:hypothetical protein
MIWIFEWGMTFAVFLVESEVGSELGYLQQE